MTAKLHIDMSQGVISIEGDPDLIREIYKDFKDQLKIGTPRSNIAQPHMPPPAHVPAVASESEQKIKSKPRAKPKKKNDSAATSTGVNSNAPKLDKNIDMSGLAAFYNRYEPKNNAEKILILSKFLVEELDIESPNSDQIYTLFKKLGEKIPKAFAQAFHDAGNKHGFIDFDGPTGVISITISGDNHFNHDLKKKVAE